MFDLRNIKKQRKMKKLSIALGCLMALGFSSCKKEYTCTCTTTVTDPFFGLPIPTDEAPVEYTEKKKKDEKDAWCESYESSTQIPSGTGGLLGTATVTQATTCTVKEN